MKTARTSTWLFVAFLALTLAAAASKTATAGRVYGGGTLNDGTVFALSADGSTENIAPVNTPQGLAFGPTGDLYVADEWQNRIFRISPSGKKTVFVSTYAINYPHALAFDSAGNLFVGHGNGIAKIAPDGTITKFGGTATSTGLAFDADGNLFAIADYASVVKYAPDGSSTTFASGFSQAEDVKLDAAGNVFVSDYAAGIIYKITPDGTKSEFVTGLTQPLGLAFSPGGELYIAAPGSTTGYIYRASPKGRLAFFATANTNYLAWGP